MLFRHLSLGDAQKASRIHQRTPGSLRVQFWTAWYSSASSLVMFLWKAIVSSPTLSIVNCFESPPKGFIRWNLHIWWHAKPVLHDKKPFPGGSRLSQPSPRVHVVLAKRHHKFPCWLEWTSEKVAWDTDSCMHQRNRLDHAAQTPKRRVHWEPGSPLFSIHCFDKLY